MSYTYCKVVRKQDGALVTGYTVSVASTPFVSGEGRTMNSPATNYFKLLGTPVYPYTSYSLQVTISKSGYQNKTFSVPVGTTAWYPGSAIPICITLQLFDNNYVPPEPTYGHVKGTIYVSGPYYDIPQAGASVKIQDCDVGTLLYVYEGYADDNGYYECTDIPTNHDVRVVASKSDKNGMSGEFKTSNGTWTTRNVYISEDPD